MRGCSGRGHFPNDHFMLAQSVTLLLTVPSPQDYEINIYLREQWLDARLAFNNSLLVSCVLALSAALDACAQHVVPRSARARST